MSDGTPDAEKRTVGNATPRDDGSTKIRDTSLRIIIASGCAGGDLCTIVGKKVSLAVVDINDDGKPPKAIPGRWYIREATKTKPDDGAYDAIKGWDCEWPTANPTSADPQLLDDSDFDSSRIFLFWVRPGPKQVGFVTSPAYGSVALSQTITVTQPEIVSCQALTTSVALRRVNVDPKTGTLYGPTLSFGDHYQFTPNEYPGIRFRYSVKPHKLQGGQICGVQLIQNCTYIVTADGVTHEPVQRDKYVLDTGAPYDAPSPVQAEVEGAWLFVDPTANDGRGESRDPADTPAYLLRSDYSLVRVDDRFRMFLMYRPDGGRGESVWVTLACIDYYWHGQTYFAHEGWSELADAGFSPDPVGVPSSKLPAWSGIFLGYHQLQEAFKPPIPVRP